MYTKHTFKGGYFMSKRSKIYRVEPLRKTDEIEEMKWAIRRGNKGTPKRRELAEREGLIFLMGINTGLRVNDLVRLKVRDVRDGITFQIREGKTDKLREINVGMLQDEIESCIDGKHSDDYGFGSQKGNHHITTSQLYRLSTDAAAFLGCDTIATPTMSQTFRYHHYKRFKDVPILQEIFNHSAPSITMRYIGIRQDEINESLS